MKLKLLLLLFCLGTCGSALAAPYTIDKFKVDISLGKDGQMNVTESITATFNEPRHGIFRFIPVHLESGKGTTRSILLTFDQVTVDGVRQKTAISKAGPNLQVRIGDADVLLEAGSTHTYEIRYHALGMLNWLDHDDTWDPTVELYWNLTGVEWDTTIGRVEATITYPDAGSKRVRARLFSGRYGDASQQITVDSSSKVVEGQSMRLSLTDKLVAERTAPLMPGEGVTVALDLPYDLISKPTLAQTLKMFLLPNLGFLIPLAVLLSMGLFWMSYGRDPKEGPIAVQFDPPDGLTGPEVGALIDERVDQRDLAAGIISLAVKGYLEIHPQEDGLIFKRRTADLVRTDKTDATGLTDFETYLLQLLGGPGSRTTPTDLRTSVAPNVGELKSKLYQSLVAHAYYLKSPEEARVAWLIGGGLVIVALGALCFFLSPTKEMLPSIVGGIVGIGILIPFSMGMPRRTKQGAVARSKVRGFAEFIGRARGAELEWMSKRHPDQSLFEEYLPHAVALGLTKEWAEAFRDINIEMPNWYRGHYAGPWSPIWFASDLGYVSDSVGSAASTPPRSSGASGGGSGFSSGGGFSGGGFGGGGGGSW